MKARYPAMILAAAATLLLAVTVGRSATATVDDARMLAASSEPDNWIVNGGDFNGRHWSSLDQINEATVSRLAPAWSFDFDTNRGQESEPIVDNGVMYVTSAWSKVYALDAATGKQLWAYDPEVPKAKGVNACCDVVNRGVALYKGLVYVGAMDARLIALDAKTGKVVWDVQTGIEGRMYTISGAPRVIRGKVIIGNGGGEFNARGYITAYDAATGKKVWRFFMVPGKPGVKDGEISDEPLARLAQGTWFGDTFYKAGGGGTAWNAIVYDQELDQILVGTGNGTPWNRIHRSEGKGDNLFLCSVLALDPDTGKYKWHYQENPGETWDYNSTQPMILTDQMVEGKIHKVLYHAPKNGFFYVIDRTDGKLISAEKMVAGVNWATHIDLKTGRPVEVPEARYEKAPWRLSPGPGGAHNWYPMALSPKTGLVYLPVSEASLIYRNAKDFTLRAGGPFNDGLEHDTPLTEPVNSWPTPKAPYYLIAWDPVAQKVVWRQDGIGGGVLATAGGLVFQGRGTVTGELAAFRATDGAKLWSYHTPNGIQPGPVTYRVNGEQYVVVATGLGGARIGSAPDPAEQHNGRVVAFKLDGKATLPADPGPAPEFNPTDRPLSPASVATGNLRYNSYCTRCHGVFPNNSNVLPDLRRSGFLQSAEAWKSVVHDGVLADRGMIGWGKYFSAADTESIRDYVDSEARAALAKRPAAPPLAPPLKQ